MPLCVQLIFKKNETEKVLCDAKSYKSEDKVQKAKLDFIKKGIDLNYQHHWYSVS